MSVDINKIVKAPRKLQFVEPTGKEFFEALDKKVADILKLKNDMNNQTQRHLENIQVKDAEINRIKQEIINFCEEEMKIIPIEDENGLIFCETTGKVKMANEVINFINNLK